MDRRLALTLDLPPGVVLDQGLQLGVRWTPLDPAAPETIAADAPTPSPSPSGSPAPVDVEPPDIALVRAEEQRALVAIRDTEVDGGTLRATVTLPAVPGLYRLSTTLHDRDGLALDAATQALVPALLVQVAGTLSAAFAAPARTTVQVERTIGLPVRVANTGTVAWAREPAPGDPLDPRDAEPVPWLVGRWIRLDGLSGALPAPATAPALVAPAPPPAR